jgi:hypothetical protein
VGLYFLIFSQLPNASVAHAQNVVKRNVHLNTIVLKEDVSLTLSTYSQNIHIAKSTTHARMMEFSTSWFVVYSQSLMERLCVQHKEIIIISSTQSRRKIPNVPIKPCTKLRGSWQESTFTLIF